MRTTTIIPFPIATPIPTMPMGSINDPIPAGCTNLNAIKGVRSGEGVVSGYNYIIPFSINSSVTVANAYEHILTSVSFSFSIDGCDAIFPIIRIVCK